MKSKESGENRRPRDLPLFDPAWLVVPPYLKPDAKFQVSQLPLETTIDLTGQKARVSELAKRIGNIREFRIRAPSAALVTYARVVTTTPEELINTVATFGWAFDDIEAVYARNRTLNREPVFLVDWPRLIQDLLSESGYESIIRPGMEEGIPERSYIPNERPFPEAYRVDDPFATGEQLVADVLSELATIQRDIERMTEKLDLTVTKARSLDASWRAIGRAVGIEASTAYKRWNPEGRRRATEYERNRRASREGRAQRPPEDRR